MWTYFPFFHAFELTPFFGSYKDTTLDICPDSVTFVFSSVEHGPGSGIAVPSSSLMAGVSAAKHSLHLSLSHIGLCSEVYACLLPLLAGMHVKGSSERAWHLPGD